MKRFLLLLFPVLCFLNLKAQILPVELMVGDKYLFHQNFFSKPFNEGSKFSFAHALSFNIRNDITAELQKMPNEVMNQTNVTYDFGKGFTAMAGTFYTNFTGFLPSFAVQYLFIKNDLLVLLKPRMDVVEKGSFEFFNLVEYRPKIFNFPRLYTRFQSMNSYGPVGHNRSYYYLRLGIEKKKVQFGLGHNFDFYGLDRTLEGNTGVFFRAELF